MSNSVRLRQLDRFADFAGLGGHAVAQLFEHIGDHHPDHDLVFDQENGAARQVPLQSWPVSLPQSSESQNRQIPGLNALDDCHFVTQDAVGVFGTR